MNYFAIKYVNFNCVSNIFVITYYNSLYSKNNEEKWLKNISKTSKHNPKDKKKRNIEDKYNIMYLDISVLFFSLLLQYDDVDPLFLWILY